MSKKEPSGQALVEYALILILVALAVVVVLAVLGPTLQTTFSNVVAGLQSPTEPPAPTATPAAWSFCADEWDYCSFTGTKQVRYGEAGHYFFGTFTNGTACTNAVFGDPLVGTFKHCYYR